MRDLYSIALRSMQIYSNHLLMHKITFKFDFGDFALISLMGISN